MGKLTDEFLSTPIPPEVWHYTAVAGLQGILASGRIWATEAHFTTDETEFVHAREVALRFLAKFNPQDKSAAFAKQAAADTLAHAFDQGPLSFSKTELFIASFCATEDLKSQWMEYGDSGRGVSLAFDLRHVRPPKEIGSAVTFAPCLYRIEDKEKMLDDALADWRNTVADLHQKAGNKQWAKERIRNWTLVDRVYGIPSKKREFLMGDIDYLHGRLQSALIHTSFDLLRIASHCKDYAFHQEAEWRLSLPHTKGASMKGVEILHRGPNNAVPYVAHDLFSERLPLTRVKVGPLAEGTESIEALLKKYGFDVPVTKSNIPLRTVASIKGNAL